MNQRQYLIKGTFLLTLAGLLTRIAGFFYKIFLSRTIGAKEIGLFQLILPVYSFCMAFAFGGIQTAIAKFTAEYQAKGQHRSARRVLLCALFISGSLSLLCTFILLIGARQIAISFLLEPSCARLIQIVAWSLPFSVVHSCIAGYFIGLKNVSISAVSQLLEQILRIGTTMLFYYIFQKKGAALDARVMALGQLSGELASSLYCVYYLFFHNTNAKETFSSSSQITDFADQTFSKSVISFRLCARNMLSISVPLGLNRMFMSVLQGIEASLLPQKLQTFGLSSHAALAAYGTLTGMALPLILFPTALTSSIATLLLPAVSEAKALNQKQKLQKTVRISMGGSFSVGLVILALLFLFGDQIGLLLFQNQEAGTYIRSLSLLCPFLYLNTTLVSVLHGLGKSTCVFIWNIIAFGIRLTCVILLVPDMGIPGYLFGTICSQVFLSLCTCFALRDCLLISASLK